MKNILTTMLLVLCAMTASATNYYVDSESGKDSNSGTSPQKAWRSLTHINETEFAPGDSLLFRRGSSWFTSTPLRPLGSGSKGKPIVISAYGEGHRPIISGDGFVGSGVINLHNQSWWVISNLEITNWAQEAGDRRGIEVKGANGGLLQGIHILDMEIHHIKGIRGNGSKEKRTAGVEFLVSHDNLKPTRFDDIRVERCHIHHIDNQGIVLNNKPFEVKIYPGDEAWKTRKFTNMVIRDNVIHNISKNAMIIRMAEGGIVEHNICFATSVIKYGGNTIFSRNVLGTVFQYNEGFLNLSPYHDGSFYDADINSPGTIWRYSYSHDNAHGLIWLCTGKLDDRIKVYDNVSENDRGYLVYACFDFTEVDVYRNLFYVAKNKNSTPWFMRIATNRDQLHFSLTDNIVYNDCDSLTYKYPHYTKKPSTRSKHIVKRNMIMGQPPIDKYNKEQVSAKNFKKFHRGFLYTTPLDKIVGNSFEQFVPQKSNEEVVGTINGLPVYRRELEREVARHRWENAGNTSKSAKKETYKKALESLALIKVQLDKMAELGMIEADVATDLESLRKKENDFRRNTSREKIMWFGPQQLQSDHYWEIFFAQAQEKLRLRLAADHKDFQMTNQQIYKHWNEDSERAETWKKRTIVHSRKAVQADIISQRYDKMFGQLAKDAVIKIDKKVERSFTK